LRLQAQFTDEEADTYRADSKKEEHKQDCLMPKILKSDEMN